jgi:ribosome recycling factor
MTVEETLRDAEHKMRAAVSVAQDEMASIRTGRANPKLLDRLTVEYYGTHVPLNQLASFSVPEPRMLILQPFDKGAIGGIEKAIMTSDLGLTPSNDGNVIRIPLPPLTEERRRELVKVIHKFAEEGRVAIRHARTETMTRIKKTEHVSSDDQKHAEKEVQKLHDEHLKGIDAAVKGKEAEVMEV